MVAADEGALACDLMETYRIEDWRELPARRAALFAYGLGEGSRIRRKLSGAPAGPETLLLAMIADALNLLVWLSTRDGLEGRNQPRSLMKTMLGEDGAGDGPGFDTFEEFDAWHAAMTGR